MGEGVSRLFVVDDVAVERRSRMVTTEAWAEAHEPAELIGRPVYVEHEDVLPDLCAEFVPIEGQVMCAMCGRMEADHAAPR